MGPVMRSQFAEDVSNMCLYRFFRQGQSASYFFIRITPSDQTQNLDFSRGQYSVRGMFGDLGCNFR